MLRSNTWSACIAVVALLRSIATPTLAQGTTSTASSATPTSTSSLANPTVAPYLASCPAELELQISICLDTVARDGAVLPCNPDDWWCNCNNWQGVMSCYQPCPNLQDQLDIDWNQQNCQGQHGYANLYGGNATDSYLGSNITTTGSNGYTRSYYSEMPKTTTASATSTWTWSSAATGTNQERSKSSASQPYAIPAGLLACSLLLLGATNLLLL
ncbi:uncharacterized protein UTRI_02250_B [Ustilago trichophora]|uniref:Extracellular membrane protein CFEM domain-containing protein n=1 Tax=Ustilago trichophora TaxID=86804 RepID=A0A5C3DX45_9BASI|nr:uncharacterized protein UTRI_02250_B [Ustilago trichophora]